MKTIPMFVRGGSACWYSLLLAVFLFCTSSHSANAHFLLNLNVRILHVEHLADGLRVYLRTPMPYLVADRVGCVFRANVTSHSV